MVASPGLGSFLAALEGDFRQISQDARRSDGFSGLFSSHDYPEIKEAAERAVLRVRGIGDQPGALDQIRSAKELLRPLSLCCESRSPRLAAQALSLATRLLSNDATSETGALQLVAALGSASAIPDEGVQLKCLGAALALLQSSGQPRSAEGLRGVLGVCCGLLGRKGLKVSVAGTAAGTLRQALVVLLDAVYVSLAESGQLEGLEGGLDAHARNGDSTRSTPPPSSDSIAIPSPGDSATILPPDNSAPSPLPQSVPLFVIQSVLEDLCSLASGQQAAWLPAPPLPRSAVLELLHFALEAAPRTLRSLPQLHELLAQRLPRALPPQLADHLDAGRSRPAFAAAQQASFRAALRCERALVRGFYPLLGAESGALLRGALAGLAPSCPLFQRAGVAQLAGSVLGDPGAMHHLCALYDADAARDADLVAMLARGVVDALESALEAPRDAEDTPPLSTLADYWRAGEGGAEAPARAWVSSALHADRASRPLAPAPALSSAAPPPAQLSDEADAPAGAQRAALACLALKAVLRLAATAESLAEACQGESAGRAEELHAPGVASPTSQQRHLLARAPPPREQARPEVAAALVLACWRPSLAVCSKLLLQAPGEHLRAALLRAYKSWIVAAGLLRLQGPRDAWLASLCDLAAAGELGGGEGPARAPVAQRGPDQRPGSRLGWFSRPPSGSQAAAEQPGNGAAAPLPPSSLGAQSMRALFLAAHRVGGALEEAWPLVLAVVGGLDRALEVRGEDPGGEVALLRAAAAALMEGSRAWSRDDVLALLCALREASLREAGGARGGLQRQGRSLGGSGETSADEQGQGAGEGAKPSQAPVQHPAGPPLHALQRMVEVVLANADRVAELWAVFLEHTLELLRMLRGPGKACVVRALGRAVLGVLARLEGADAGFETGVEHMLLAALEAIAADAGEGEVRLAVLRALLSVLERHGERLSAAGWAPAFRLLAAVPASEDAQAIALGFAAVQLLAGDLMAWLPLDEVARCVAVAASYGTQQVDVNVSLTAISLLWNAADMLGRREDEQRGADSDAPAPAAGSSQPVLPLAKPTRDDLLETIFASLASLSSDPRPEVRNSGTRTLFAVVTAHGARLARPLWERCVWEQCFPLLQYSLFMALHSSREQAEAALLGSSRGRPVRMLLHHSRNSEQKRWDESVVVALNGMARLLRAHLPAVLATRGVGGAWEELMVVVEGSLAGGRKEVAMAAVSFLMSVLQMRRGEGDGSGGKGGATGDDGDGRGMPAAEHAGLAVEGKAGGALASVPAAAAASMPAAAAASMPAAAAALGILPRSLDPPLLLDADMWRRALRALSVGVEASCSRVCGVPLAVRLEVLAASGAAHEAALARGDLRDVPEILGWICALGCHPWSDDDASNSALVAGAAAGALPPVQKAALALMPSLFPEMPAHQGLWPQVLDVFLRWLRPEHVVAAWTGGGEQEEVGEEEAVRRQSSWTGKQQGSETRFALSSPFLCLVCGALADAFAAAPAAQRAACLASVVAALGGCMEVRYVAVEEPLWRAALAAFEQVAHQGVLAFSLSSSSGAGAAFEAVAEVLEAFLLGAGVESTPRPRSARQSSAAEAPSPGPPLPARRASLDAAPPPARSDAEAEAGALDVLVDEVLASELALPAELVDRLVQILRRGIRRPLRCLLPGEHRMPFAQSAVRKLFVLCSRGGAAGSAGSARALSSGAALPLLVLEARELLESEAGREEEARGHFAAPEQFRAGSDAPLPPKREGPSADLVLCVLDALLALQLAPGLARGLAGAGLGERLAASPRKHLLVLYPSLARASACASRRVRDRARDALLLAGVEVGLCLPADLPRA